MPDNEQFSFFGGQQSSLSTLEFVYATFQEKRERNSVEIERMFVWRWLRWITK
jgi:hypothetical protein